MTDHDPVTRPAHYRWLPGDLEVIDITEGLGFCMGNVVKYVLRADHKGAPVEDLKKARWYLDREIARREAKAEGNGYTELAKTMPTSRRNANKGDCCRGKFRADGVSLYCTMPSGHAGGHGWPAGGICE